MTEGADDFSLERQRCRADRRPERQVIDTPRRSEAEQAAFFDGMLARAQAAEDAAGVREDWFDIAGICVRILFAGPALADGFTGALAHLRVAPMGRPDATLHVWDSASTGVAALPPPCTHACFTHRGDIWGLVSPRYRSAFHGPDFALALLDGTTAEGVYWARDAAALPYTTNASPLRSLFHWLMERAGKQLLHAAAVGDAEGAVLITGKGGLGKSTMALACLQAGMTYLGDDYVVVGLDPAPCVFSLYSTAKLDPGHMAAFPALAPLVSKAGGAGEKSVLTLYPARAGQIARALPLRAVLTPRIRPEAETIFAPITKSALARAAAFTTMAQLPHAGVHTEALVGAVLDKVPGLEVRPGASMTGIAAAVRKLLADPAGVCAALPDPAPANPRPLVSVIIPVFNGARFLPEAIASVMRQNYPALEIIVVDDGSQDAIEAAVAALPVAVRFFRLPCNLGPAAARNRGVAEASGAFIAFLDVDDLWTDHNLHTLVDALAANPGHGVALGPPQIVLQEGATGPLNYMGSPVETFPYYVQCGLFKREALQCVGRFDETLRYGEDLDWFKRAGEAGLRIAQVDQVSCLIRRHGGNTTFGKTLRNSNVLRVMKKAIERGRAGAGAMAPITSGNP
jgi:hypothetical protein